MLKVSMLGENLLFQTQNPNCYKPQYTIIQMSHIKYKKISRGKKIFSLLQFFNIVYIITSILIISRQIILSIELYGVQGCRILVCTQLLYNSDSNRGSSQPCDTATFFLHGFFSSRAENKSMK